jgi:hypothetical protein
MKRGGGDASAIIDKWQLGNQPGPNVLGFDEWCLSGYGGLGSPGGKERYWHPSVAANGQTIEINTPRHSCQTNAIVADPTARSPDQPWRQPVLDEFG